MRRAASGFTAALLLAPRIASADPLTEAQGKAEGLTQGRDKPEEAQGKAEGLTQGRDKPEEAQGKAEGLTQGRDKPEDVLVRGAAGNFASRASIQDSPREITDAASLVEPMPGVHVRRLGADDSFATMSIRGSTSSQVAVYIAGVPLSGGADPTLDLATLPLWPGARATVHRTFAPAALGRGSLGGSLVIDPPTPRGTSSTEVWAAAGSFDALRLRVGDVRQVEALGGARFSTGLSASRSADDFSYFDGDRFTTRANAGHASVAGLESIALPIRMRGGDGALTVTMLAQARRQELPGSIRNTTPLQRLDSSRLVQALELSLPAGPGAASARAWARREGLALRDDPNPQARFGQPQATDDAILAAGGSIGWRGRPHDALLLEMRLDGSGERFAPGTWISGTAPPSARRANGGFATDASLRLGSATVSASGRADVWVDRNATSTDPQFRPTGHAGVELPAGPIVLATHAGFVTRPASFVERYGNRGAFLSAPDLRPESAFTTDAGARWAQRLGPLRVRAELAGFAQWADDLITYVYQGSQRFARATNIGQARLYGLESELRGGAYGFDVRVSYTGLLSQNLEPEICRPLREGGCSRPPLPGRPSHDLVADLSYEHGPVRVRYGIDYVSGMRADLRGNVSVPPRALQGASLRVAVPSMPGLALTLDVRNLFDLRIAHYATASSPADPQPIGDLFDYPLPGRRVLFSARWSR